MPKARNLTAPKAKPAKAGSVKPVKAAIKQAATKPEAVARTPAHITRTIATVARAATNYAELTERDGAYFTFYKRLAAANGGKLTVAAIVASGGKPSYTGSCKPHDAGVIVRLTKAGLLAGTGSDASPISVTKAGSTRA